LEKRLRGRGTESAESLEKRLHNAREEMTYMGKYDYLILNDVLDDAVASFEALIRSLRLSVKRMKLEDFQ
jgi:guanylate kinase